MVYSREVFLIRWHYNETLALERARYGKGEGAVMCKTQELGENLGVLERGNKVDVNGGTQPQFHQDPSPRVVQYLGGK